MKDGKETKHTVPLATHSTSKRHDIQSAAGWIVSEGHETQTAFLNDLSDSDLLALPYLFEFWAFEHQLPPDGDWKNWVIMGGRGAGKTRAGSEWVRSIVEGPRPLDPGKCKRVALVGETIDQVREVMVFGESGIMACTPPDRRPDWQSTRKTLVWPNGAEAQLFSAHNPEALRGPQFDAAWVDELAKWKKAQDTWDMLNFTLRLGEHPQVCITTTPRNVPVLKDILALNTTVVTQAPTEANRAYLAKSFLEEVRARYAGTRLGRQELDGVLLEETEGALWTLRLLDEARVEQVPDLTRVVVAVDPPVTGNENSDECGIVVAGVLAEGPVQDWRAYVLADRSVCATSPSGWAKAAIRAMEEFGAEKLVAEVNQGGDLVETVIRQVDPTAPYRAVHASRGKVARAEPVAALYEQGRVRHVHDLDRLEDQMRAMTIHGFEGRGSPDRVDALVWALHELIIEPAGKWRRPRVRAV